MRFISNTQFHARGASKDNLMALEYRLQLIDTARHFTPSASHSAVIALDLYQCASAVLLVSAEVKATGFGAARASGALCINLP